jgi:hypothetical protein
MFSKEKKYETWAKPKLFWHGDHGYITRIKLYGYQFSSKGNFYVYIKQDHLSLSGAKYIKDKKTWVCCEPKDYDQDKSFIINVMIEKKKEQIKDQMIKIQKSIDDAPQYLIRLKDRLTDLEKIIKMVSEEKYGWKSYVKSSEQTPEPLKIYDETKDNSGETSVHF